MRLLITVLLLAMNAVLAINLVQKWLDGEDFQFRKTYWAEPRPVLPSKDSMVSVEVSLAALDISGLSATSQRPLFFSSRRPPSPPPPPPPVVQPPPPPPPDPLASLELYGLVSLGDGKGSVVAKVGGAMRRLAFGEKIGEWTLKGVAGRDALFVAEGSRERKVTMTYRSLAQAAPQAAARAEPKPGAAPAPSAPAANASFDQLVQERRDRINKARINAGLKPFDTW
ncbi:MAG: hypothetical protein IPN40_12065 [Uliginosibacterium sp.]|nr:hypothetical protein [Uliginosibacterium sp.]